jgi:hypothetical protein
LLLRILQKTCFVSCYDPVEIVPSLSAQSIRSRQTPKRSSSWTCVRTRGTLCWVTRVFRSSDRILWQVPWLIPASAAVSSTVWERWGTNVAISYILSSVLTVLGRPIYSSSKLSLACVKRLYHLRHSTTVQGFFAIRLLGTT